MTNKKEITYDKGAETASFYGFHPVEVPSISRDISKKAKDLDLEEDSSEYMAILEASKNLPRPTLLYCKKPFPGSRQKSTPFEYHRGLSVIGISSCISDLLLIQTTRSILLDEGFSSPKLEINYLGDQESIEKFEKDLVSYYRKNINDLSPRYRQLFKKNIFNITTCDDPNCGDFCEQAPQSLGSLSDLSRGRFMEILEFLERLDIPYEINKNLVRSPNFWSGLLWQYKDNNEILAYGGRIDRLFKKMGNSKEIPSAVATIQYSKQKGKMRQKKKLPQKQHSKFFFVQVGSEAKKRSLYTIEILRKKRIKVHHNLVKDKCVSQISIAEKMNIPYILIMGQKEALENSVLVRNTQTRVQETINIDQLPDYLKKLK